MTPDILLAAKLFDEFAAKTRRGRGIERETYGPGEQAAHVVLAGVARALDLEIRVDAIGNLFATRPGRDRRLPAVMLGSHLDSVPQGGNFDGAAGVLAGLAIVAGITDTPSCDVTVVAVRGEESAWFDVPYIGSQGMFGKLSPASLDVRRLGTGPTLRDAMRTQGRDSTPIRDGTRLVDPATIACWLELHIEQGPVLVEAGVAAATVTGIRGCRRFRNAACHGQYGHSGAHPRASRHDAVAATVALLAGMEEAWLAREAAGEDVVFTVGELYTDAAMHGPSKVAGETHFVLDIRSLSDATMNAMAETVRTLAARIGAERRVTFDLGGTSDSVPAPMDPGLRAKLRDAAVAEGLPPMEMASGAGHDAAVFAAQGIATAMVFVRNEHGSHNPDEAMTIDDFAVGTRMLARVVEGMIG